MIVMNITKMMKNAVFWNVTPCGSCKNRRFGGMCSLHHLCGKNQRAKNDASINNWSILRRATDYIRKEATDSDIRRS
jgi:hypothetical protein